MNQKKYFTPPEATQTLPLVRRIVTDILDTGQKIRSLVAYLKDEADSNSDVEDLIGQLNVYFQELEDLGCYYKDWSFGIGLVDFPSIIENEEVSLCWRSDEKDLQFYHNHADGYAERKPIPPEYLNGNNGKLAKVFNLQK
jgi:hypothetical protein